MTNPSIDGKLGFAFNNNDLRGPMGVASSDNAAYVTWADSRATGAGAALALGGLGLVAGTSLTRGRGEPGPSR